LVVVCKLEGTEQAHLRDQAEELGIKTQVVLTNFVQDAELAALYRMATVQFFPSLYEGFGMPVLDAMLCGLPVITSNVSALPEVAGDAAVLVDPVDLDEMAGALTRVLESDCLRGEMRARGRAQAAHFRWDNTADKFRAAYSAAGKSGEATVTPATLSGTRVQLRNLALVSPLPPQRSGVADFAAELLGSLRQHLPVTAFVEDDLLSSVRRYVDVPVESIVSLPELVRSGRIDAVLYEVGNSVFHHFQLPYFPAVPGVVEMHDGILHGLMYSLTFEKGDKAGYRQELSYAHGPAGRKQAERVIEGRQPPALYDLSVSRRVVNDAIGIVVHNHWAAAAVRAHGTNVPTEIVYHPVAEEESAENLDRRKARMELGIAPDTVVVATFGRLAPAKRLEAILHAFAKLRHESPLARLFLVGELDLSTDAFRVPGIVEELGIAESVHITGYVDRPVFVKYMAATDVALNLRYPHAGETSGTLVRLLNAGVPTIASNLGAFVEVPDDCCWKVDVDDTEQQLLLAYLRRLTADPALRRRMGSNAARFAKRHIPYWGRVADSYLEFIERAMTSQAALAPRVQTLAETVQVATLPRSVSVGRGSVARFAEGLWQLLRRSLVRTVQSAMSSRTER
jgi:glycosyltransferase involved in cell wall biosynthesis